MWVNDVTGHSTSPGPAAGSPRWWERAPRNRKLVFWALLVLFSGFLVYGLAAYQFDETSLNGRLICLSCIGVGG